LQTAKHKQV